MKTRIRKRSLYPIIVVISFLAVFVLPLHANADVEITVKGSNTTKSGTIQGNAGDFSVPVPLKENAVNVFTVEARDSNGNVVTSRPLQVTQVSLDKVVVAKAESKRLTTDEIKELVAQGVVDVDDPENYNVSKFDVTFTVNNKVVQVHKYVPQPKYIKSDRGTEPIEIDLGGSGGGGAKRQPKAYIFEINLPLTATFYNPPPIPAVLLIDGDIKTLKEFFNVKLIIFNTSDLFALEEIKARIVAPDGLTNISPASGQNSFGNIQPNSQVSRDWVVRGDKIGHYNVKLDFAGNLTGPGFSDPVPISGSASTSIEVKGPPHLAVVVEQPDRVTASEPYQLLVNITNTSDIAANFASITLNLGENLTFDEPQGPHCAVRDLGNIQPGETVSQSFTVYPKVTGLITSCVGAASENIQLFVHMGDEPCATGSFPADTDVPSGRAAVRIVPVNNTTDVAVDTDEAGNTGQSTIDFSVVSDTSPPVLEVINPSTSPHLLQGDFLLIRVRATDNVAVSSTTYFLDNATEPIGNGSAFNLDTTDVEPGNHIIKVVASDCSGNQTVRTINFNITVPAPAGTTPPEPVSNDKMQVIPLGSNAWKIAGAEGAAPPLCKLEIITPDQVSFNGSSDESGSFEVLFESEGGREVSLFVIDSNGQRSDPADVHLPAFQSLAVDPSSLTMTMLGEVRKLQFNLVLSDGSQISIPYQGISAEVDNPSVVKVTSSGEIIAMSSGQAHVTFTFPGLESVTVPVSVNIKTLESLELEPSSITLIDKGQTEKIRVIGHYSDGSSSELYSNVSFISSNPNVVVVNGSGTVTALSDGESSITATVGGLAATCSVTVSIRHPISISVSPQSVHLYTYSDHAQLAVTLNYDDGSHRTVTSSCLFNSSDTKVALVTATGAIIAGQMTGSATVTVKYDTLAEIAVPVVFELRKVTALKASPSFIDFTGLGQTCQLSVSYLTSDGSTLYL